jgi:predicted DsbA family dithiol-disulfide isomerase
LKQDYDIEVVWEPYFLRPDALPEGMATPPYILHKWAQTGNRIKQMADEAGLPMIQPDWWPNTRRALEATEYARDHGDAGKAGVADEFHHVVFRKYYAEGENIGSWDVLREAAAEVGLDADAMQRAIDAGDYREVLERKIIHAYQLGVSGVPFFVFDSKYAISGAQPYETFRRFMEKYVNSEHED